MLGKSRPVNIEFFEKAWAWLVSYGEHWVLFCELFDDAVDVLIACC